ncbi:MAG: bis-aminopropyl spermidine synthase family protein [Candidatus Bathyarchaeia archaeon]
MRKVRTQILINLLKSKKSFWELLDESRCLVKDFVTALNDLFREGLIGLEGNTIYITEKGLKEVNRNILDFKSETCDKCGGKGIILDGKFKYVLEEFKHIAERRPPPKALFFQGYMREYDVISRIALMHKYDDLANKDFILIGDDDLLSVALALTELPSKIFILDIDERLGDFIKAISREYGFEIEFQKYDVSNPLPRDLRGSFDVFSSEPLETLSGLKAFLSRGVACLRENGVGYFGLSTAESSPKKWMLIERLLLRMNCVITDIIKDFSRYKTLYETVSYENFTTKLKFQVEINPGIYWYKSSLFRFEITGRPKPSVNPDKHVTVIYVDRREDVTNPFLYVNPEKLNAC